MIEQRLFARQISGLLDVEIKARYDKHERVSSSELVEDLEKKEDYKKILDKAAPFVVHGWFAELVRERLHKAALDSQPEQYDLDLPSWDPLNLQGAYCVKDDEGSVVYVRHLDFTRAEFKEADRLLSANIRHATKTRHNLRMQNSRLEPLREKYGDLKVRELIKLARKEMDTSDEPRERQQPGGRVNGGLARCGMVRPGDAR